MSELVSGKYLIGPHSGCECLRAHRLAAVELLDRITPRSPEKSAFASPCSWPSRCARPPSSEALWDVLASLRSEARPYRQVRWDLDVALAHRDLKVVKRLAKALKTDVDSVPAAAGDAVAASSMAAIEQVARGDVTGIATGVAAVQGAGTKLLDSSIADHLAWRLRRPHLLWINNVMDEAKHLTEALPDVGAAMGGSRA